MERILKELNNLTEKQLIQIHKAVKRILADKRAITEDLLFKAGKEVKDRNGLKDASVSHDKYTYERFHKTPEKHSPLEN